MPHTKISALHQSRLTDTKTLNYKIKKMKRIVKNTDRKEILACEVNIKSGVIVRRKSDGCVGMLIEELPDIATNHPSYMPVDKWYRICFTTGEVVPEGSWSDRPSAIENMLNNGEYELYQL